MKESILKGSFDLSLVIILKLVLVAHHQVGMWHTKLSKRNTGSMEHSHTVQ